MRFITWKIIKFYTLRYVIIIFAPSFWWPGVLRGFFSLFRWLALALWLLIFYERVFCMSTDWRTRSQNANVRCISSSVDAR